MSIGIYDAGSNLGCQAMLFSLKVSREVPAEKDPAAQSARFAAILGEFRAYPLGSRPAFIFNHGSVALWLSDEKSWTVFESAEELP